MTEVSKYACFKQYFIFFNSLHSHSIMISRNDISMKTFPSEVNQFQNDGSWNPCCYYDMRMEVFYTLTYIWGAYEKNFPANVNIFPMCQLWYISKTHSLMQVIRAIKYYWFRGEHTKTEISTETITVRSFCLFFFLNVDIHSG